jgi:hypothetical protein
MFMKADHPGHQFLEVPVAADQFRFREAVLQVTQQGVGVISERDCADHPAPPR